jgi:hypothetical protein
VQRHFAALLTDGQIAALRDSLEIVAAPAAPL